MPPNGSPPSSVDAESILAKKKMSNQTRSEKETVFCCVCNIISNHFIFYLAVDNKWCESYLFVYLGYCQWKMCAAIKSMEKRVIY